MHPEKQPPHLDSNFLDRKKQLDNQLSLTEKSLNKHHNHRGSYVPRIEDLAPRNYSRDRIKGFRGKESIFKRPEVPPPRMKNKRTIADFRINPQKWTYYNLEDVPDMSDESNTKAAFSFLTELRERREREAEKQKIQERLQNSSMEVDEDDNSSTSSKSAMSSCTVKFQKPLKIKEKSVIEELKPEFRNNVVVMPEYEFGTRSVPKKKKSQRNVPTQKLDKSKQLKLDHLQTDDDQEE